ncbi:hypothetical protein Ana3638_18765 [Anaerocolumna sedimenticola]|uniref:Nif11 domain-containing protein n=1 Tax=Anaerocolumna sedimenticola TaxID=2696063 RepID=A0A6P1TQS9_9FIRM|nr:hypothetical protein [Anaerocolumna sedimenticola]QHQ62572.1 hypothetical protein Ana3638_18765 [Anaerocolumna sedimenticola]
MSLQKEIMALTKEQKAKLAGVRNEQELIDAISEAGIELTDEEVSKVAGGGNMLDWRCDRVYMSLSIKNGSHNVMVFVKVALCTSRQPKKNMVTYMFLPFIATFSVGHGNVLLKENEREEKRKRVC